MDIIGYYCILLLMCFSENYAIYPGWNHLCIISWSGQLVESFSYAMGNISMFK